MIVRTRFAPSPTGRLHLGHALAARVAHHLARQSPSGIFLLRHEDIDGPRVMAGGDYQFFQMVGVGWYGDEQCGDGQREFTW